MLAGSSPVPGTKCAKIVIMDQLTRVVRAAGILDGEGTFSLRKNGTTPVLRCQMTDEDIILELQDLFGGKVYVAGKQKEHHKQSWIWQLQGAKALESMLMMKPYLFKRRTSQVERVEAAAQGVVDRRDQRRSVVLAAVLDYRTGTTTLRKCAKDHSIAVSTLQKGLKEL